METKRDPKIVRKFLTTMALAGVTCMPAVGWTDFCSDVRHLPNHSDWSCQCATATTGPNGMCVAHPSVGLLQPAQQCPSGSVKAQWPTGLGPNGEWQETFIVCMTCANAGDHLEAFPHSVLPSLPSDPPAYRCCSPGTQVHCTGTTPRTCSCH